MAWYDDDTDSSIWGSFGSRDAWEKAYKAEHGYFPGQGPQSYEDALRDLLWSQDWQKQHGTQPITQDVWESHYYRPGDLGDTGQYAARASSILSKYRAKANQPSGVQPLKPLQSYPTALHDIETEYSKHPGGPSGPYLPMPIAGGPQTTIPIIGGPQSQVPPGGYRPPTQSMWADPSLTEFVEPPRATIALNPPMQQQYRPGPNYNFGQTPQPPTPPPPMQYPAGTNYRLGANYNYNPPPITPFDPSVPQEIQRYRLGPISLNINPNLPGLVVRASATKPPTAPAPNFIMQGLMNYGKPAQNLGTMPAPNPAPLAQFAGVTDWFKGNIEAGKNLAQGVGNVLVRPQGQEPKQPYPLSVPGFLQAGKDFTSYMGGAIGKVLPSVGGVVEQGFKGLSQPTYLAERGIGNLAMRMEIDPKTPEEEKAFQSLARIAHTFILYPDVWNSAKRAKTVYAMLLAHPEDTEKILKDEQSPGREFIGEAVFDPLNLLNWGSKIEKVASSARKGATVSTALAEGAMRKATTPDEIARATALAAKATRAEQAAVRAENRVRNVSGKLFPLGTEGAVVKALDKLIIQPTAEAVAAIEKTGMPLQAVLNPRTRESQAYIAMKYANDIVGALLKTPGSEQEAIGRLKAFVQNPQIAEQWIGKAAGGEVATIARKVVKNVLDSGKLRPIDRPYDPMDLLGRFDIAAGEATKKAMGLTGRTLENSIVNRVMDAEKAAISLLNLVLSPGYAITNTIGDHMKIMVDGLFSFDSYERLSGYLEKRGVNDIGTGFLTEAFRGAEQLAPIKVMSNVLSPLTKPAREFLQEGKILGWRAFGGTFGEGARHLRTRAVALKKTTFVATDRIIVPQILKTVGVDPKRLDGISQIARYSGGIWEDFERKVTATIDSQKPGERFVIYDAFRDDPQLANLIAGDHIASDFVKAAQDAVDTALSPDDAKAKIAALVNQVRQAGGERLQKTGISSTPHHDVAAEIVADSEELVKEVTADMAQEQITALAQKANKAANDVAQAMLAAQKALEESQNIRDANEILLAVFEDWNLSNWKYRKQFDDLVAEVIKLKGTAAYGPAMGHYKQQKMAAYFQKMQVDQQRWADGAAMIQRVGAGEPLEQVLGTSKGQRAVDRLMAILEQKPVDVEAIKYQAIQPVGVEDEKFKAMRDAQRVLIDNAAKEAIAAAATKPGLTSFSILQDANFDVDNLARASASKVNKRIKDILEADIVLATTGKPPVFEKGAETWEGARILNDKDWKAFFTQAKERYQKAADDIRNIERPASETRGFAGQPHEGTFFPPKPMSPTGGFAGGPHEPGSFTPPKAPQPPAPVAAAPTVELPAPSVLEEAARVEAPAPKPLTDGQIVTVKTADGTEIGVTVVNAERKVVRGNGNKLYRVEDGVAAPLEEAAQAAPEPIARVEPAAPAAPTAPAGIAVGELPAAEVEMNRAAEAGERLVPPSRQELKDEIRNLASEVGIGTDKGDTHLIRSLRKNYGVDISTTHKSLDTLPPQDLERIRDAMKLKVTAGPMAGGDPITPQRQAMYMRSDTEKYGAVIQQAKDAGFTVYRTYDELPPVASGKVRLYHGTYESNLESIGKEGLIPGGKWQGTPFVLTTQSRQERIAGRFHGDAILVLDVDLSLVAEEYRIYGRLNKNDTIGLGRVPRENVVGVVVPYENTLTEDVITAKPAAAPTAPAAQMPVEGLAKGAAKEPWQMTDAEIRAFVDQDDPAAATPFAKRTFLDFPKKGDDILADYDKYGWVGAERRWGVESALRKGKPVPAEVLADYPDLAKAAPKAAEAAPVAKAAEHTAAELQAIRDEFSNVQMELEGQKSFLQALKDGGITQKDQISYLDKDGGPRYITGRKTTVTEVSKRAQELGYEDTGNRIGTDNFLADLQGMREAQGEVKRLTTKLANLDAEEQRIRKLVGDTGEMKTYEMSIPFVVDSGGIAKVTRWTPDGNPIVVHSGGRYSRVLTPGWKTATADDFAAAMKAPGTQKKMADLRMWQDEFRSSGMKTNEFSIPFDTSTMKTIRRPAKPLEELTRRLPNRPPIAEDEVPAFEKIVDVLTEAMMRSIDENWEAAAARTTDVSERMAIQKLLADLRPTWATMDLVSKESARALTYQALLDYSDRSVMDVLVSWGLPFSYWYTHMGKEWGKVMASRPGIPGMLYRYFQYADRASEQVGAPKRSKGSWPIAINGEYWYFDPTRWLPYANMMRPFESLDDMYEETPKNTFDRVVRGAEKYGLWLRPSVSALGKATGALSMKEGETPFTQMEPAPLRGARAAAQVVKAKFPEAPIPYNFAMPQGDIGQYYLYRGIRELQSDKALGGTTAESEARRTEANYIISQATQGKISWDEAFKNADIKAAFGRVAAQTGARDLIRYLTGAKIEKEPAAQRGYRDAAAGQPYGGQPYKNLTPEQQAAQTAYLNANPEARGVNTEPMEIATSYFWNLYHQLPPDAEAEKDETVTTVIGILMDKTRTPAPTDKAAVEAGIYKLQQWLLIHPQTPAQIQANQAVKAAEKEVRAKVVAAYPEYNAWNDAYWALPEAERSGYLWQNPYLAKAWEYNRTLKELNPIIQGYYSGKGVTGATGVSNAQIGSLGAGVGGTGGELWPMEGHWPGYGNINVAASRVGQGKEMYHVPKRGYATSDYKPYRSEKTVYPTDPASYTQWRRTPVNLQDSWRLAALMPQFKLI